MGARQRAQKRGKSTPKAVRGSLKGSPSSQKNISSSIKVPTLDPASRNNALLGWQNFAISSSPGDRNGLSMRQAAWNTERQTFGWGPAKLRDSAITFVSAGHLHQDEVHNPLQQEASSVPSKVEEAEGTSAEHPVVEEPEGEKKDGGWTSGTQLPNTADLEFGDQPIADTAAFRTARERSPSLASSDSEQIVFTGRANSSRIPSHVPSRSASTAPAPPKEATENANPGEAGKGHPPVHLLSELDPTIVKDSPNKQQMGNKRTNRRGRQRPRYVSDEEEAIMQDYIANMAMDDSEESEHATSKPVRRNEHFRLYDGAGDENVKVKLQGAITKTSAVNAELQDLDQAMDWNSDDLELFDNFSTDDENVEDVEQILRQRERESGIQYLVTARGRPVEDAKWILRSRLVSESALEEIRIFEEIQAMEFEEDSYDDEDESTNSDEQAAMNDLVEHIESEDDENARILAHTSRMSDEQIAKALAKQEELGMGGDEVLLFSGEVDQDNGDRDNNDDGDGDGDDIFGRGDDFISFSAQKHTSNRTRSKHNKKQRDSFPSASLFADVLDQDPYGGFDVMDFDRPSLRPRKKGRKSGFPYELELEDEDLKAQLESTWLRDREKKASRKREKEEARMTAVFEASERGEPSVIKSEIRRFLCQEIEVLRLAPMDPGTRASVHRLAKALRLNSRSEGVDGKGKGRYPVLTKTVRTPSYTIDNIWEVDALLNTRKFFPKNSTAYKSQKAPRGSTARLRRSGGVQGASYMNGEVVGASAPEIGADNKGRAMLEKMGWSSGMGIGAEGNKGSLEAIKHVVKTTKAGLG